MAMGLQFAGALILAVFAGQWVDDRFGTGPWGVLGGAALGFGAGFYLVYRAMTAPDRQKRKKGDS